MVFAATKSLSAVFTATLIACLLFTIPSVADDFPGTLVVDDGELILNGQGKRKKAIISLYDTRLYVGEKGMDAAAIVTSDEPMAMRLRILSRFISSEKMQKAMQEGFEKSTGGNTNDIRNEIEQFETGFADEIRKQDVFDLIYQPGSGTEVKKNGETTVVVEGLEFKQALFGIWLSENPVQASLKKDLLGG